MHTGYRLVAAVVEGRVEAVAGYRFGESLAWDTYLYVDDLVTDERARSKGHGKLLLDCPRGALALVEQLPLGRRELTLGGRLRGAGIRLGEPCSQLVLAFGDAGLLGR